MIKNLMGNFTKEVRFSFLRNKNMLKCGRKYTKQTVNKYRRLLVRNFSPFFFFFILQYSSFFFVLDQSLNLVLSAIHHKRFRFYSCFIIYPEAIILCIYINNDKTTHIFYLYTYSCSFVFTLSYFWFVYLRRWF